MSPTKVLRIKKDRYARSDWPQNSKRWIMLSVLVMQWDTDAREHVYYNPDGSTTTDPDAAEVWDDVEAANLAAEQV